MKVHFDFSDYNVRYPVITTGVFDGVHKGHVEILNMLKVAALQRHGETVVVTFWPHPKLVVHQDYTVKLLNTLEEKFDLLEQNGIEHVVVLPFTEEFSNYTSAEYVQKIIVEKLNARHLIMGFNHHFGKGREGNFESMQQFGLQFGFSAEMLPAQLVENEKVSSTIIRKALNDGDVSKANTCLGYNYMLTGKVVEGHRLGRTIGFPTANVSVNHDFKLVPKEGVYAVWAIVDGIKHPAMLNMGFRPTVNTNPSLMTIEAHLLGYSGDLYGKDLSLIFVERVRDETKFLGIDELKAQLSRDKMEIAQILGV